MSAPFIASFPSSSRSGRHPTVHKLPNPLLKTINKNSWYHIDIEHPWSQARCSVLITVSVPILSMYGIFTYIWLIFMVNAGKYIMNHTWVLSGLVFDRIFHSPPPNSKYRGTLGPRFRFVPIFRPAIARRCAKASSTWRSRTRCTPQRTKRGRLNLRTSVP